MRLRAAAWLALVIAAGCGGSSSDAKPQLCAHPAYLDASGPGMCNLGRAALSCEDPALGGCECVTNDATCSCGAPCTNRCKANEYAARCGGPPMIQGAAAPAYVTPPAECHSVADYPSGASVYCCPCQ